MTFRGNNKSQMLKQHLSALQGCISDTRFEDKELDRCAREVELLQKRLLSREYQYSHFQPRNTLSIPDRVEEFFGELNFLSAVGALWHHLFHLAALSPHATVLDVGCGFFPKVEMGLYYHGFEGVVHLCDPHRQALEQASRFLKFFSVPYEVKTLATTLWDVKYSSYDYVVANHFIDDVLLVAHAQKEAIEPHVLYQDEALYRQAWKNIYKDTDLQRALALRLAQKLHGCLGSRGTILLADYTSFSHKALKVLFLNDVVKKFKKLLVAHLEQMGMHEVSLLSSGYVQRDRIVLRSSQVLCYRK